MHNTVLNVAFLDHELGLAELQPRRCWKRNFWRKSILLRFIHSTENSMKAYR